MSQRNLELIFGTQVVRKINQSNLLIVGVGGIGCQLLKNLCKAGFRRFTILDLDTIEQTNLNRQFIFRKEDVGQYKSIVGRKRTLDIDPTLDIVALKDDIKGAEFNVQFFKQFNIVVSALDNMKARAHVGMMCIKAGCHMVDAGTQGFNGQTRSVVKGISQCHNCRSFQTNEQTFAVCTIRSRPEQPIHCITYAKNFYDCFFGADEDNSFKGEIKLSEFIGENVPQEAIDNACQKVFEALFYTRIAKKVQDNEQQNRPSYVHPLTVQQALKMTQPLTNPKSTYSEADTKRQNNSLYEQEKLWSISTYTKKFLQSMANILKKQKKQLGSLTFEKDDDDCMMLVYCISTLRTFNFMNRQSAVNKHKYQTFYECKDMAGNIIPAIASTNAIAAATEVQQIIKILSGNMDDLKYINFYNDSTEKVSGSELSQPNISCSFCSKRSIFLSLECNFDVTTYGDVDAVLRRYLSYSRQMHIKYPKGDKAGQIGTIQMNFYGPQLLNWNEQFISDKQTIVMDIVPNDQIQMHLGVQIKHREDCQGIQVLSLITPEATKQDLLEYKRQQYEKTRNNCQYDYRQYVFKAQK